MECPFLSCRSNFVEISIIAEAFVENLVRNSRYIFYIFMGWIMCLTCLCIMISYRFLQNILRELVMHKKYEIILYFMFSIPNLLQTLVFSDINYIRGNTTLKLPCSPPYKNWAFLKFTLMLHLVHYLYFAYFLQYGKMMTAFQPNLNDFVQYLYCMLHLFAILFNVFSISNVKSLK